MSKQEFIPPKHIYIFYTNKDGCNIYERTTSEIKRAQERVEELKKIYPNAFYFEDDIPKDLKWYY